MNKSDLEIKLEEYGVELDELKRVLAFLFILEDGEGMRHPEYILEKYMRYIKAPAVKDEYLWGLHPALMRRFAAYCEKCDIDIDFKNRLD